MHFMHKFFFPLIGPPLRLLHIQRTNSQGEEILGGMAAAGRMALDNPEDIPQAENTSFNIQQRKRERTFMKAEFINPFLTAAKNVLETMAQTQVSPQKPRLKDGTTSYGEVTGIIGMTSGEISGSMIVSFTEKCILKIVANMLMEEPKAKIDDEVVDAVGELTNMICGGAKAQLAKLDHKFDLATPNMVVGKGVEIAYYSKAPTIVIPFETAAGPFVVEANLSESR